MKGMLPSLRRLPENIQTSIILAMFISAIIGFVPNYDRMIYLQTEPVDYFEAQYYTEYTGYPAGDDVPELALHIFLGFSEDTMTKSAFVRFMNRDENKEALGQLFS